MTDPQNAPRLMRFTNEAMGQMDEWAESEPEMWLDRETDFLDRLRRAGVKTPDEESNVTGMAAVAMPMPDSQHRQRVDEHSLRFAENLTGMTPDKMADRNLLTWLSCIPLHEFGLSRWHIGETANVTKWVKRHFVARSASETATRSVAGRILWLAETSRRIAKTTTHTTPQQVLNHFATNPEHYHQCIELIVMRSARVASEYILALMRDAQGISREGARELAREMNRAAGARLLDAVDTVELKSVISKSVDKLMRQKEYVTDRSKLRGRKELEVLSLGAGTQSTVMALMAEMGYEGFSKPDIAIFADTGWEPKAVYENLEWLKSQVSFPIETVSKGNIKEHILSGMNPEGRPFLDIPIYLKDENGKKSMATRQCTRVYKMEPIFERLREILEIKPGKRAGMEVQVNMWIGITLDEATRQKQSKKEWIRNYYPFIEKQMSRAQLLDWFHRNYSGRSLPKSACIGCPFHTDSLWAEMKTNDPESFQDAVNVDWAIRNVPQCRGRLTGTGFLHKTLIPLSEVNFDNVKPESVAMQEECEGLCGI